MAGDARGGCHGPRCVARDKTQSSQILCECSDLKFNGLVELSSNVLQGLDGLQSMYVVYIWQQCLLEQAALQLALQVAHDEHVRSTSKSGSDPLVLPDKVVAATIKD